MTELFRHPLLQAALWFALILVLLALAIVGVRRLRGDDADDQLTPNELLTKFRELHGRGGLSDAEYRTIKTKLATQINSEPSITNGSENSEAETPDDSRRSRTTSTDSGERDRPA